MTAQPRIIFQPYVRGKRGALEASLPVQCQTTEIALRKADAVAGGRTLFVGAHVVRMVVDEDAGDYGEPEFLVEVGEVPSAEG